MREVGTEGGREGESDGVHTLMQLDYLPSSALHGHVVLLLRTNTSPLSCLPDPLSSPSSPPLKKGSTNVALNAEVASAI